MISTRIHAPKRWAFVLFIVDFLCRPQFLHIVWAYCEWISHDFRLELKIMCFVFYSNSWFILQLPIKHPQQCFHFLKGNNSWWIIERIPEVPQCIPETMAQCLCHPVPHLTFMESLWICTTSKQCTKYSWGYEDYSQMTVHWQNLGFSLACSHLRGSVLFISTLCKIQKSLLDCKEQVHCKRVIWPRIHFIWGHPACLERK